MNVLITGGTGFVGRHLADRFLGQGHAVTLLGSRSGNEKICSRGCRTLQADTTQPGDWQQAAADADLIVNLAGRTIFQRWSESYKQQMHASRIRTTQNLVDALPGNRPVVLISTSAVGYYGDGQDTVLSETAPGGDDFLSRLCVDWEHVALGAVAKGARVVLARFGIVLSADGGALAKMLPGFRLFAGGPLGSGRQWFPWIHMADLLAAIDFLAGRGDLSGAFNLCSPHPVRNRELAQTLGRTLGRPAILPAPALALRLFMGEMAGVLLAGQRAVPERLMAAGFQFQYPRLDRALSDLLR
ncbi:MAG: TIGR01777 family protein [Desulfobacterales bacterium]|nr:TIGR01777 family protein [Desulfobacterales bacterium]